MHENKRSKKEMFANKSKSIFYFYGQRNITLLNFYVNHYCESGEVKKALFSRHTCLCVSPFRCLTDSAKKNIKR